MKHLTTTLALVITIIATSAAASLGRNCSDFNIVKETLGSERWGETPQVHGLSDNGVLTIIFANPETGSWTLVLAEAGGKACLVSSGIGFVTVPQGDPA